MIDTATRAENTILNPANNAFLFSVLIFEREEVFSDVPLWLRQRPAFLVLLTEEEEEDEEDLQVYIKWSHNPSKLN
ncbi:hypothetical protein AtNW77_Chr3g0190341 [Arabidopsis thaliana]